MLPTARLTLADTLRSYARSRAGALCLGDGNVRLTWRETDRRTNQVANALRGAGVGSGDRVLWLGQNSFRLQELLLACAKLGAMFCPANWRQGPDELAFVIDDLSPSVVVAQETDVGDAVRAGRERATTAGDARWLWHDIDEGQLDGGSDAYEPFVAAAASDDPGLDGDSDDALLLVYTAAFSGRPNAAMLSSRALLAQGALMAPWQGIDEHSVFLNSGPLFHIGTFMPNLSAFAMGGANVFVARSDGDAMCRAIASFGCTSGFLVGPMVDAVVEANARLGLDLSTFHGYRGNPAFDAMVQPDVSPWGRNAGGYGQTEVMGMATFNLLGSGGAGTHGRPSPLVQIRVVDDDDDEVEPGAVGEIAVRGTTVMNGYWNRDELNAERSRNGWHHTNDLGRYERDGTFSFIAPKGRMLKSAAENIYPAEVENAVRSHPAVAECAVIGVPDDVWVQAVKAIVVVAEGAQVGADEIIDWCRHRIASYKKPRTVEFVDALPRAGFFVDYDDLDRRYGGGNYPGGSTRSA